MCVTAAVLFWLHKILLVLSALGIVVSIVGLAVIAPVFGGAYPWCGLLMASLVSLAFLVIIEAGVNRDVDY